LSSTHAESPRACDFLDRSAAALARRVEGRGADRHHLLRVRGFHRLDRVPGIDRALEGRGIDHRQHFRDHHHVQKRRHARQDRLGQGTRGGNDMLKVAGQRHDQRGGRFGHAMAIGVVVGEQHLADARQRCRLGRSGIAAAARDQHRHRAKAFHRGQGLCHLIGRQFPVDHIGQKKNGHLTAPPLRL